MVPAGKTRGTTESESSEVVSNFSSAAGSEVCTVLCDCRLSRDVLDPLPIAAQPLEHASGKVCLNCAANRD